MNSKFADEVFDQQTQEYFENLELHALVGELQNENIRLRAALRRSESVIEKLNSEYLQKNPLWKDMTLEQKIERNNNIALRKQAASADALKMPTNEERLEELLKQTETTDIMVKAFIDALIKWPAGEKTTSVSWDEIK